VHGSRWNQVGLEEGFLLVRERGLRLGFSDALGDRQCQQDGTDGKHRHCTEVKDALLVRAAEDNFVAAKLQLKRQQGCSSGQRQGRARVSVGRGSGQRAGVGGQGEVRTFVNHLLKAFPAANLGDAKPHGGGVAGAVEDAVRH
jgi:hypothetical protein